MESTTAFLFQILAANQNGYAVVGLVAWGCAVYARAKATPPVLAVLNGLLALGGLLAGLLFLYQVSYTYAMGLAAEQFALSNRYTGPYWWAVGLGWLPLLLAQLFWWARWRTSRVVTAVVLLFLWADKLSPFLTFLCRECLPSTWLMLPAPENLLLGLAGYGLVVWGLLRWREAHRTG